MQSNIGFEEEGTLLQEEDEEKRSYGNRIIECYELFYKKYEGKEHTYKKKIIYEQLTYLKNEPQKNLQRCKCNNPIEIPQSKRILPNMLQET